MTTENISTGRLEIVCTASDDGLDVVMQGQIDERTELVEIAAKVASLTTRAINIDLEKVSFINSVGVREWIRLLRALKKCGASVRMRRCSEAMIHQMNMIVEAKGSGEVDSFFAPYVCDGCGYEGSMCLDVEPNLAQLRDMQALSIACPECTQPMEFNDIPERYLLFLEDVGT